MLFQTSRLALIAATLLSIPLVSFAALTETSETVTSSNDLGPIAKSGKLTFDSIPDFNPSLGQLVEVKFELTLDATPFLEVLNEDHKSEKFAQAVARESGTVTLDIPTTGKKFDALTLKSGLDKVPASSGTVTKKGTPGSLDIIDGPTTTVSGSQALYDPTDLRYSGTGTYDLTAIFKEIPGFAGGRGPKGVFFGGGDDLSADLSVQYFYLSDATPPMTGCDAPEPSTLPLVAFSLGALFLGRRLVVKRA